MPGVTTTTTIRLPRVQVTKQSHVGAPPWVELYGFRNNHGKYYYLSPWEFTMWWYPVRLWPPCHPHCGGKTVWTDEGKRFYELHRDTDPPVALEPGQHYVVLAHGAPGDHYYVYPDEPLLHRFRLEWVLRRHERPMVPSPAATPLPNFKRSKEENARIFSTYLRPWVLSRQQASSLVPHLADLDLLSLPTTAEIHRRCSNKKAGGAITGAKLPGTMETIHPRRHRLRAREAHCGKFRQRVLRGGQTRQRQRGRAQGR